MRRNHQRLEAQPAYESAHLVAQDLVGRIKSCSSTNRPPIATNRSTGATSAI